MKDIFETNSDSGHTYLVKKIWDGEFSRNVRRRTQKIL
jgi:hypothetical protein